MMSRHFSSSSSKKEKSVTLDEDSMLHFDEIVKWEVKDMCYWLQAVRFY